MPWDGLKECEAFLKLRGSGMREASAVALAAALHMTPESLEKAILYMCAENLDLIAHVEPDEELVESVNDMHPGTELEGFDVSLGNFKLVVIAGLVCLRNKLRDEYRRRA